MLLRNSKVVKRRMAEIELEKKVEEIELELEEIEKSMGKERQLIEGRWSKTGENQEESDKSLDQMVNLVRE